MKHYYQLIYESANNPPYLRSITIIFESDNKQDCYDYIKECRDTYKNSYGKMYIKEVDLVRRCVNLESIEL